MLVGGGGLLLLVLAGGLLYLLLTRGSGDELFQLAEQDYSSQSYGQAISKYEKFLSQVLRSSESESRASEDRPGANAAKGGSS